ncbi:MAG: hypothetical protein WBV94_18610, partial [Blastocatellia bacterium]
QPSLFLPDARSLNLFQKIFCDSRRSKVSVPGRYLPIRNNNLCLRAGGRKSVVEGKFRNRQPVAIAGLSCGHLVN